MKFILLQLPHVVIPAVKIKNPCSLFRASYRLILTWRHLSCHDVDEREALTLGGQHKYLPVEWLG